jgi:hypothetical protein
MPADPIPRSELTVDAASKGRPGRAQALVSAVPDR